MDDDFLAGGQRQAERVGGLASVQVGPEFLQQVRLHQGVLVAAFNLARNLFQPLPDRLQVGQHQFGGHNLDIPHRVNVPDDVNDIRILETAHHLDERIHLPDVAEELIAKPLSVRGAFDQAGDVHELEGRRNLSSDLNHLGQLVESGIGHADNTEVGFDGTERVIFRRGLV